MDCLALGSYDGALIGFDVDEDGLKQSFGFAAHVGCVKSMAATSKILVSGGSDEVIRVYDINRRVEMGNLYQHKGTVTCLKFHGEHHLISGGADGLIVVWRVSDWEMLHSFKAHSSTICDLSVHPSGRLALSVGMDKKLRMWDLMNGTCAVSTDLAFHPQYVQWSPEMGSRYAVLSNNELRIVELSDGEPKEFPVVRCPGVTSMFYASERCIILGFIDGSIAVYRDHEELFRVNEHQKRVKAIVHAGPRGFCSVSTDGDICIWQVDVDDDADFVGPESTEKIKMVLKLEGGIRTVVVASNGTPWREPAEFGALVEGTKKEKKKAKNKAQLEEKLKTPISVKGKKIVKKDKKKDTKSNVEAKESAVMKKLLSLAKKDKEIDEILKAKLVKKKSKA